MIHRNWVNIGADSNGAGGVINTLPCAWPADVPINPGDITVFGQSTAPTGFTKLTTHNDKALRIVSGTASSGGTSSFTTVFTNQTPTVTGLSVGSTTVTTATMPGHTHLVASTSVAIVDSPPPDPAYAVLRTLIPAGSTATNSGATGGGLGHSHPLTPSVPATVLNVAYVDIILAQKD